MAKVDWSVYAWCNACLAPAGQACWSLQIRRGRRDTIKWPHQRRKKRVINMLHDDAVT